jgi:hypothetical protein
MSTKTTTVVVERRENSNRRAKLLLFLLGAGSALFLRERVMRNPTQLREFGAHVKGMLLAFQRLWVPGLPVEARAAVVVLLGLLRRGVVVLLSTNQVVARGLTRTERALREL